MIDMMVLQAGEDFGVDSKSFLRAEMFRDQSNIGLSGPIDQTRPPHH